MNRSLFLGGVLASIAIYLRIPFTLVIIAIIPVLEALSDILQVIYGLHISIVILISI